MRAVVLSVLLLAAPAVAQDTQSFETQMLLIANPCLDENLVSGKLEVCRKADTDLINRAAQGVGPLNGYDANIYHTLRAIVNLRIGSEQGRQDGARSRRSCETMEQAWAEAAAINTAYSPQRADMMNDIRQSVIDVVRVCRKEQGKTRAWAPDLP
jgi:hypothetical protein